MSKTVDLLVIGGGINGVGIAADAAGRGLSVCLCERDDLASHTSSSSTKLIHGGLRYLEQYEFGLVRESLRERLILLKRAPHLVKPLEFHYPHTVYDKPSWMVRAGLFLYDHLARHDQLPSSRSFGLDRIDDHPLRSDLKRCFSYTDCKTDDARLVLINAQLAREKQAEIKTRCEVISAQCDLNGWQVNVRNTLSGELEQYSARAVVNASGAWVDELGQQLLGPAMTPLLRCVKGSHFIVRSFYEGDQAYLLRQPDNRVVFAIPYQSNYCLVGTTDEDYSGDLAHPEMSEAEAEYLLSSMNQFFSKQHTQADILGSFAGIRSLYDNGDVNPSTLSRKDHLEMDVMDEAWPLIHVVGGKMTTYRSVAETVVERLRPFFPAMGPKWTQTAVFAGSNWSKGSEQRDKQAFFADYSELPVSMLSRAWESYGLLAYDVFGDRKTLDALGGELIPGLSPCEIQYMRAYEWAHKAEDVLWRRSKLGLLCTESEVDLVEAYLKAC